MNPPAPVTHIFNFFSGQYGSVPYTPRNSYPAAAMVRDRRVAPARLRVPQPLLEPAHLHLGAGLYL